MEAGLGCFLFEFSLLDFFVLVHVGDMYFSKSRLLGLCGFWKILVAYPLPIDTGCHGQLSFQGTKRAFGKPDDGLWQTSVVGLRIRSIVQHIHHIMRILYYRIYYDGILQNSLHHLWTFSTFSFGGGLCCFAPVAFMARRCTAQAAQVRLNGRITSIVATKEHVEGTF